jgi:hypothetical protein
MMDVQLSPAKLILCDFEGKEFEDKHPDTQPDFQASIDAQNLENGSCFGNTLYDAWRYLYVIGTNTEQCIPYNQSVGYDRKKYKELAKFQEPSQSPLCSIVAGVIGDMCADVHYDEDTGEELGTPARFYRALHFYAVPGVEKDGGSEEGIRHTIFAWGPVSTGMEVYPNFYTFDAANEIYKWDGKGPKVGGHAIEIVGWGEEKGEKYWIIKNSWGKEWGRDGYFYMSRGDNNCKIEENVLTGVPDFFYPYGYDLASVQSYWMENPKSKEEREQLSINMSITGGGLDPESGYTRRVIITKPWVDLKRPFPLDALPDQENFVAGIDAATYRRFAYQRNVKQSKLDINYGDQNMWIIMIVMAVLIGITLFVIGKRFVKR